MDVEFGNTRILVVSNDSLTRAGLATLLAGSERFSVVGRVPGDSKIVEEIDIYRPDVILWDLGWEQSANPLSAVAPLRALVETGIPVVAMLTSDTSALAAWSAGARGLLMRNASTEQIVAALDAALEGLVPIDPALIQSLLVPPRPPDPQPDESLTPRELEVLRLIAEGRSNRAIAHQLEISEHTVKFHINAIMTKLNAESRTEAVVRATRLGLISL